MSGAIPRACGTSSGSSASPSKRVKLSIEQLDLGGRRVFLRADLNAPLEHGAVSDDTRLRGVVPTIRYALDHGAAVVLASHLGRPKGGPDPKYSLKPVAERLATLLALPVLLARVDALVIGGGMAFTFLRALGHDVGRSLVEPERIEMARAALEAARRRGVQVVLPVDAVVADGVDSPVGRAVSIREIPAQQM